MTSIDQNASSARQHSARRSAASDKDSRVYASVGSQRQDRAAPRQKNRQRVTARFDRVIGKVQFLCRQHRSADFLQASPLIFVPTLKISASESSAIAKA